MGYRMSDNDWAEVMATDTADHRIARMLGEEYTWGWATCWFSDTGEFGPGIATPRDDSYATGMIHALFGWWQTPDRNLTAREQHVERLMTAYLAAREAAGDTGEIDGFQALWPQRPVPVAH
jgi:hypothetical protein